MKPDFPGRNRDSPVPSISLFHRSEFIRGARSRAGPAVLFRELFIEFSSDKGRKPLLSILFHLHAKPFIRNLKHSYCNTSSVSRQLSISQRARFPSFISRFRNLTDSSFRKTKNERFFTDTFRSPTFVQRFTNHGN